MPVFAYGSIDPDMGNKEYYKTFVRVGTAFSHIGNVTSDFFKLMNWTRAVMYFQTSDACAYGGR